MTHKDKIPRLMDSYGYTALELFLNRKDIKSSKFISRYVLTQTCTLISLASHGPRSEHTLARAVSTCSTDTCDILLRIGFNPNSVIPDSFSCIWCDSAIGSEKLKSNSGRETALHCAVALNSLPKVSLLLQYSPDLSAKWRGMTPLELAIAYNVRPEILELLSKDMSKYEIAKAIDKCNMVGESIEECVTRTGVDFWSTLFGGPCQSLVQHSKCDVETKLRIENDAANMGSVVKIEITSS